MDITKINTLGVLLNEHVYHVTVQSKCHVSLKHKAKGGTLQGLAWFCQVHLRYCVDCSICLPVLHKFQSCLTF